jgi:hypothetical protein
MIYGLCDACPDLAEWEALPSPALDDERREDERRRPVALGPELHEDDRNTGAIGGGDEGNVFLARLARDHADDDGDSGRRVLHTNGTGLGPGTDLPRKLLREDAAKGDSAHGGSARLGAVGLPGALGLANEWRDPLQPHVVPPV